MQKVTVAVATTAEAAKVQNNIAKPPVSYSSEYSALTVTGKPSNWATIQAQQRLHGDRFGRIACVSAADLTPISGDTVHINTASQVTLGGRYATAMHALLDPT